MYSPLMVAEAHENPADFAQLLAALPEHDRKVLDAFLELRASISALARHHNWPIADIVAWMQRKDIRPILRAIAESAEDALRIRAALARQTAIDTLEQAALAARAPIDQRRAGIALARACQSERAMTRAMRQAAGFAPPADQHTSSHDPSPPDEPEPPRHAGPAQAANEPPIPGSETARALTPRQIVSILLQALAESDETSHLALQSFTTPGFQVTGAPEDTPGNDQQTQLPPSARAVATLAHLKNTPSDSITVLQQEDDTATLCITAPGDPQGESNGDPQNESEGKSPSTHAPPQTLFHFHRAPDSPWLLTKIVHQPAGP